MGNFYQNCHVSDTLRFACVKNKSKSLKTLKLLRTYEIYVLLNTSFGKVFYFFSFFLFLFLFRSLICIYLTVIVSPLSDILDFRFDCFHLYRPAFSFGLEIIEINKSHHTAVPSTRPGAKTNKCARLSGKQSLSGESGA